MTDKHRFPAFEQAAVLVLGDVMLDRYWHGATSRISPEAPVQVVKVGDTEDRPGGAANVARNLAALGCQVKLGGLTGADADADSLKQALLKDGIEPMLVADADAPTITKLRVVSHHQQLLRLDFEQPFGVAAAQRLSELASQESGQAVWVLSDYAKGALQAAPQLIQQARAKGITVLVDPKGDDFAKYRGANVLTPNFSEFQQVVGPCASEAEIEAKAQALLGELDLDALLVTRSEQGMSLFERGKPPFHLPALVQEVYDVTGAGDTVISTLAATLAAGEDLQHAVRLANTAAGLVVRKAGTSTVSRAELRSALRSDEGFSSNILDSDELVQVLEDARIQGEKIVFTNGCFDILHAGHVTYLEKAKVLGDRLIVALNDDASVSRLKGPERPINALEQRMAVIASLASVDWVVSFSEDTPLQLIQQVLPDVLVKGGDYQPDAIVGADVVKAKGGVVEVIGFVDGQSTSQTISKIKRSGYTA